MGINPIRELGLDECLDECRLLLTAFAVDRHSSFLDLLKDGAMLLAHFG